MVSSRVCYKLHADKRHPGVKGQPMLLTRPLLREVMARSGLPFERWSDFFEEKVFPRRA